MPVLEQVTGGKQLVTPPASRNQLERCWSKGEAKVEKAPGQSESTYRGRLEDGGAAQPSSVSCG